MSRRLIEQTSGSHAPCAPVAGARAAMSLAVALALAGALSVAPAHAAPDAAEECAARDPVKDRESVERYCSQAIGAGAYSGPDLAALLLKRGDARARGRSSARAAVADLDRAIELDPSLAQAFRFRGLARYLLGENDAAVADFDIAIGLAPSDARAYANRGLALKRLGDLEGAIADYTAALKHNQDDDGVLNNRALARMDAGDRAGALLDFEAAFRLGPRSRIRRYQRIMADRGVYDGPDDGVYGASLRRALIACIATACLRG